jgi:hypothetical protein
MRPLGKFCRSASAALGMAWALGALAAEQPAHPPPAGTPAKAPGRTPGVAGLGPGVASSVLANLSGGSDVSENITITGNVSDTSTENVSTGMNWIGGGSFGNAAGLPIVIQNTGNSVLIQNATVVNVQMQP